MLTPCEVLDDWEALAVSAAGEFCFAVRGPRAIYLGRAWLDPRRLRTRWPSDFYTAYLGVYVEEADND